MHQLAEENSTHNHKGGEATMADKNRTDVKARITLVGEAPCIHLLLQELHGEGL